MNWVQRVCVHRGLGGRDGGWGGTGAGGRHNDMSCAAVIARSRRARSDSDSFVVAERMIAMGNGRGAARAYQVGGALAVAPTLATDFHRVAHAQGIGATGKQRVLLLPIQRGDDVSSVVPGRVDEYIRTLLEMSGKVEVLGLSGLVDKPVKPVVKPVKADKTLLKADETLWKGKEAYNKRGLHLCTCLKPLKNQ